MFQFDKEKIIDNYKNILLILVLLIVLILFSFSFNIDENVIESELDDNGNPSYSSLVINEIMSNNDGIYADAYGNIYDWIEIYNGSNREISLKNYTLSDEENTLKWAFGDVTIKSKSYIIVFLSGEEKEGLYANFKLNKNGNEKLILKNQNGKIIDLVETIKTDKNNSLARDLNGNWKIVKKSTPGFDNTKEGYNNFIDSLNTIDDNIEITEILVKNGGQFTDNYGIFSGYIELANITDEIVNLKGYSLSNDINKPFKWNLPDIEMKPGEILLIYTSGKDVIEDILHTNFNLDSRNGNVILSKNGKIVRNISYDNLPNGYALTLIGDTYKKTGILSGGFLNNHDGTEEFAKKNQQNKESLIINEVMNNNFNYLVQNGYEFYDWIELKNNSKEIINLKDYYFTTTLNDLNLYNMPDVTLNPGQTYIIMASGDPNLSNNSYFHSNFKISETESLYIIKDEKVIDSMFICDVPVGYSFGRDNNYGFIYMNNPSPNKNNDSGKYDVAYSPEFSIEAGVYNDVDEILLEIKAPGTIYYTLDGSNPTVSSMIYKDPIKLTETTVVKAMSTIDEKINSNYAVASYIINENHTLPVVSVSLNPSKFSDLQGDPWNEELEYDAYAELFEEGKDGFSVPCGLKLFGGSTRGLSKKSFSLKFRKEYGLSKLHYQVFENRNNSVYNTLVLRSGSQDYSSSMLRDPMMTSLMEGTEVDVQAYKPIILYINGNYWGVYYIREKVDEYFISSHYNVSPEGTNIVRLDGVVSAGSKRDFNSIVDYVNNHNMANMDNYNYIKEKIDIDNFITYWVAETYITNNDIINCRLFSHPNIDNGKWHMIFYDLDYAMYNIDTNYYYFMTDIEGMSAFKIPTDLMRNLMKNSEFRKRFVEILSDMLNNVWTDENILNRIDEIYNKIEPEMKRNQKRWGQTILDWNNSVDELKEFVKYRKKILLNQTKLYFNLTNEEMHKYFGDIL